MEVALTELKLNVGKYVDIAQSDDVIITRYGKPAAKITRYDKDLWYMKNIPDKVTSVEQLFGTLPSNVELDDIKAERLDL